MTHLINALLGLGSIVLGTCLIGTFISVGYIVGFRTCQKSYKEMIYSFELRDINEDRREL